MDKKSECRTLAQMSLVNQFAYHFIRLCFELASGFFFFHFFFFFFFFNMQHHRSHSRKQMHPQRSLKQLHSMSDKVMQGIIVVEPTTAWELSDDSSDSSYTKIRISFTDNRGASALSSLSEQSEIDDLDAGVLMSQMHYNHQSNGSNRLSTTAASSRKRQQRSASGSRSEDSDASIDSSKDGEYSNKHAKLKSKKKKNRTQNASSSRQNTSRSPAPIGVHLPADQDPNQIAHRVALFEALLVRRRNSGVPGSPLDITDAPGSSLLDDDEFELCSNLRLYPLQYFQSRDTLVTNYHTRGFYKKSAAQKMLRIDVNKTGKLYDYFVSRRWMPETPSSADVAMLTSPPNVHWKSIEE